MHHFSPAMCSLLKMWKILSQIIVQIHTSIEGLSLRIVLSQLHKWMYMPHFLASTAVCVLKLGIFYRLFTLLENDLDLKSVLLQSSVPALESYAIYAAAMQRVHKIKEEIVCLEKELKTINQLVSYLTLHLTQASAAGPMTGLHQRLVDIKQAITNLVRPIIVHTYIVRTANITAS